MLSVARRSAIKARTQAINQLHTPGSDRSRPGQTPPSPTPKKPCGSWPAATKHSPPRSINSAPGPTRRCWPLLGSVPKPPPPSWSQPVTTPQRLTSEASFAALCGASPVQASSGRTNQTSTQPGREPPGQQRCEY